MAHNLKRRYDGLNRLGVGGHGVFLVQFRFVASHQCLCALAVLHHQAHRFQPTRQERGTRQPQGPQLSKLPDTRTEALLVHVNR